MADIGPDETGSRHFDADRFDVRRFILEPDLHAPQDWPTLKDWMFVNDFQWPVPPGRALEEAIEANLEEKGFTEVRVNSQREPAAVEVAGTAPGGPLSRRGVMGMMRVLARTVGYAIPEGRLIANVRGHRVEAAFDLEAVA